MDTITGKLNEMQKKAVLAGDGPVLILAGAGSGKTRVLTHRLAYLVMEKNVPPRSIMAITFTNKAAREIRTRVARLFGESVWFPWAGTFHSICLKMLKMFPDSLGYRENFVIYDQEDQKTLVKDCLKELNMDSKIFPPRMIVHSISRAKDELIDPEKYKKSNEGDYRLSGVAEVYELYQKKLLEYNAMDFGDLIFNAVTMLENFDKIRGYFQNLFRHILIDEYQDTNLAQYKLANILSRIHENIFVVGDDDQSIYGWRGADIRNILEFEKDYKGCLTIRLEQNYRSTKNILAAANDVIRNNAGRKGKTLWSEKGDGSRVQCMTASNDFNEAEKVASIIAEETEKGRKLDEFAVLYRVNAQSLRLEQALKTRNISYKVFGGTSFFQRKEVKDIIAYMKLALNPDDNVQLKRIINMPRRGIGKTTVTRIEEIAASLGSDMYDVAIRAGDYSILRSAENRVKEFTVIIEKLRKAAKELPVDDFYDMVIEASGLVKMYEAEGTVEARSRIGNIRELKSAILSSMEEFPELTGDEMTLEGFLSNIALSTDADEEKEGPYVSIMTLHSAKGLEFPTVFIIGMEEGIFPSYQSITESADRLEEERRLCYVGITRAMDEIYLFNTSERTLYGHTQRNLPSRFLAEISPTRMEYMSSGRGYGYGRKKTTRSTGFGLTRGGKPIDIASLKVEAGGAADVSTGQRVSHRKFGEGVVTSSEGTGEDKMIVVEFEESGTKRLMASYAKLKVLED